MTSTDRREPTNKTGISVEQHRQMGLILGYPQCCIEAWVSTPGAYHTLQRGAVAFRKRTPEEISDLQKKISNLLGRPWRGLEGASRILYVPCLQCYEKIRNGGFADNPDFDYFPPQVYIEHLASYNG